MPPGPYNSSKTRVVPVFDQLRHSGKDWVRQLLLLAEPDASSGCIPTDCDLSFIEGYWGDNEKGLDPPVSLLSWLIRNLKPPVCPTIIDENRQKLLDGDPVTIAKALLLLRSEYRPKGWYIFEGQTFPDAFIVTPDALVVVEGKRTEPEPTKSTTWLSGRHQIWRHIDAAWEIRGNRHVYGLFIVEGDKSGAVPPVWEMGVQESLTPAALATSFPHRGNEERETIASCLLGATTWQRVCECFGFNYNALPDLA